MTDRRTFLRGLGTLPLAPVAAARPAAADGTDDLPPITDRDDVDFQRETSVAWILERFTELDSADHPLVGQDVSFVGVVVSNLENESENLQLVDELQWENFHWAGSKLLSPLIGKLSWANPLTRLTGEFYERIGVLSIAGVGPGAQRFYDRYEATPIVSAFVPDRDGPPEGSYVRFEGTVKYADSEESLAESRDGPYVEVERFEVLDDFTSIDAEATEPGDRATFVGLKKTGEDVLSTFSTDLEYRYDGDAPPLTDGSLVRLEGRVTEADFRVENLVRQYSVGMDADRMEVLVGDQTYWPDRTDGDDGVGPDPAGAVDIVLVADVSQSMSETDTRTGESRLQIAKRSAEILVNLVEDGNRFGLVSFDTSGRRHTRLRTVDGDSRDAVADAIDQLTASGETSIGAGLATANELFDDSDTSKVVFLLSDGDENTAPYAEDVLPELQRRGVTVFTVGMGGQINRPLLERIAGDTGGDAVFAPEPRDIRRLYHRQAGDLQQRPALVGSAPDDTHEEQLDGTASVDGSCDDVQFSATGDGSDVRLSVSRPDGTALDGSESDVSHRSGPGFDVWTVDDPTPGEWTYEYVGSDSEANVEVNADTPLDAELYVSDDVYEQTGLLKVELKATDGRERYTGGSATVEVVHEESGETREVGLEDTLDGPDRVPDDGIYTGYVHPERAGIHRLRSRISGGPVEDFERRYSTSKEVDRVVSDPVRPYEPRTGDGWGVLGDYGPVGAVLGVLVTAGALVLRWMNQSTDAS